MKPQTKQILYGVVIGLVIGWALATYQPGRPLCVPCTHSDGGRGFAWFWFDTKERSVCWPCEFPYNSDPHSRRICKAIKLGLEKDECCNQAKDLLKSLEICRDGAESVARELINERYYKRGPKK